MQFPANAHVPSTRRIRCRKVTKNLLGNGNCPFKFDRIKRSLRKIQNEATTMDQKAYVGRKKAACCRA